MSKRVVAKSQVAGRSDFWDDEDHPTYDPRKVEWWLAPNNETILCGDPEDPEIVCTLTGDDPMLASNRTNMDTDAQTILLATHIINLHNTGIG